MAHNGTVFEFGGGQKTASRGKVLIVPLVIKPPPPMQMLAQVDHICDDAISELLDAGALGEKVGRLAHTTRSGNYRRILAVSLGEGQRLEPHHVREAAARTAEWLIDEGLSAAGVWIDGLLACRVAEATREWAIGMALAGYRFDAHKRPDKKKPAKINMILRSREANRASRVQTQVRDGLRLAEAINYTRQLAQQPGNIIHPAALAAEARKLARQHKLKCTVIESPKLKQLGMNGLLSVGQGATHASRLIQLGYRGAPGSHHRTVLVGKALTFDTGGYSIKPSAGLAGLKFDKTGGCTVMGILKAAALLKLKCNITGLVAAAENMVSRDAYRPGDIIRMMNGKTVEVTNTDAEGRLVLADALTYAQKHCKPTSLIDIATLTGGVRVALGTFAAGIMSNNDELCGQLGECGRRTRERLWRLPLWDD
ncbi:MAG: leucyl aminopeptidase family protein, partial [Phycisphaerae bacterium]|nr:leucyl aminopeptidase family protein [Phycisphaerae bacterium]